VLGLQTQVLLEATATLHLLAFRHRHRLQAVAVVHLETILQGVQQLNLADPVAAGAGGLRLQRAR
jgi:hypothetical protein